MTPQDDPATGTPGDATGTDVEASTGTLGGGSEDFGSDGSASEAGGSDLDSLSADDLRKRLIEAEQRATQSEHARQQLLSERSRVEEQRRQLAEERARAYALPTSDPGQNGHAARLSKQLETVQRLAQSADPTARDLGELILALANGQAMSQQELAYRAELAKLEPEIQGKVDNLVRSGKATFEFAVEVVRSEASRAKGTTEQVKQVERQMEAQAKRDSAPATGVPSQAGDTRRRMTLRIAEYQSKMDAATPEQKRALMADVDRGIVTLVP